MQNCKVCGSKEQKLVYKPLRIFNCRACGFHYRDCIIPSSLYKELPRYKIAYDDKYLLEARYREAAKRSDSIKKFVRPDARILEIGCGEGTVLEKLKSEGFTVKGIEPNIEMVKTATSKGLDVLSGTIEENEGNLREKFDCVVMFHVFEHLNDPERTLDSLRELLNASGTLILELPGFDSPMFKARKWKANWLTDEHLNYFTKITLIKILKQSGFKTVFFRRKNWDEDNESLRNNILRLPIFSSLYRLYRRLKEGFEPSQIRNINDWKPIVERMKNKGFGKLIVDLINIFDRGDALFVVAEKIGGLPPRTQKLNIKSLLQSTEFFALSIFALFLTPLTFVRKHDKNKILIVPTSKLGDLVSQLPFFDAVKDKFPKAELSALLFNKEFSTFLEPYFNKIIITGGMSPVREFLRTVRLLLSEGFGSVYLLPWCMRLDFMSVFSLIPSRYGIYSRNIPFLSKISRKLLIPNTVEFCIGGFSTAVYLKLIGINKEAPKRSVAIKEEWATNMGSKTKTFGLGTKKAVGIIIGCGNKLKLWSGEKWAGVCDYLSKAGYEVFLIGSQMDRDFAYGVKQAANSQVIDTTGLFTLIELAAFMNKLNLVIGVDSGPLYLANAVGTTVIDIVGPIDPKEQPPRDNIYIVRPKAGCAPCSYVIATETKCRFGTRRCLEELMPEDVNKVIEQWLSTRTNK